MSPSASRQSTKSCQIDPFLLIYRVHLPGPFWVLVSAGSPRQRWAKTTPEKPILSMLAPQRPLGNVGAGGRQSGFGQGIRLAMPEESAPETPRVRRWVSEVWALIHSTGIPPPTGNILLSMSMCLLVGALPSPEGIKAAQRQEWQQETPPCKPIGAAPSGWPGGRPPPNSACFCPGGPGQRRCVAARCWASLRARHSWRPGTPGDSGPGV